MDLAAGESVFSCTVAYGFAGLMTGVFKGQSKTACAVAYVLSNAVTVLLSLIHI